MTKYGFIARVAMQGYDPIGKVPVIAEGGTYDELYIIDPERADFFCQNISKAYKDRDHLAIARNIRFLLLDQWQRIIKSFDGHEPEAHLYTSEKITPENLRIKLRVMLDDNGNQITEDDLARHQEWTYAKSENEKSMIVTDSNFGDGRIYGILKQMQKSPSSKNVCINCGSEDGIHINFDGARCGECWTRYEKILDDWRKVETTTAAASKEEKESRHDKKHGLMIEKLVMKLNDSYRDKVIAYSEKLNAITDEQIEKEFKMEFGE